MPATAKDGDLCTGHGGYPPRTNTSASPDVFVNGMGILRVTDTWDEHCNDPDCHTGTTAEGSSTVFANGLAVARIGDHIDCGSSIAVGSGNVFTGG